MFEHIFNRILGIFENKFIKLSLIWEHIKFNIFKVTWGKFQSTVDFCQVILGTTKNVDILDFVRHTLNEGLLNTKESTKRHKVVHRVEHRSASHNPLNLSLETT